MVECMVPYFWGWVFTGRACSMEDTVRAGWVGTTGALG